MIDIFDKLNAAYGDQTLADSDQIKDKKFGKKQDVLNKEILDPDDPNSLKSKVDSFNGIVIDPDNVVSTDKSDIEVGSSKIPTGNAVAGALSDAMLKTGVFDISAYNLTNDQPTPYADLEAALGNNGENVPEDVRKGGMQVKFIQGSVGSSDNKYVQYRYMGTNVTTAATFTNVANWQISTTPQQARFQNIKIKTPNVGYIMSSTGTPGSSSNFSYSDFISVCGGMEIVYTGWPGNEQVACIQCYDEHKNPILPSLLVGDLTIKKQEIIVLPDSAKYVRVCVANSTHDNYVDYTTIAINVSIDFLANAADVSALKAIIGENILPKDSRLNADTIIGAEGGNKWYFFRSTGEILSNGKIRVIPNESTSGWQGLRLDNISFLDRTKPLYFSFNFKSNNTSTLMLTVGTKSNNPRNYFDFIGTNGVEQEISGSIDLTASGIDIDRIQISYNQHAPETNPEFEISDLYFYQSEKSVLPEIKRLNTEILEAQSEINSLSEEIFKQEDITATLTETGELFTDGGIGENTQFSHSNIIAVKPGNKIIYTGWAGNNLVSDIQGFDDEVFVRSLLTGLSGGIEYRNVEVTIPEGITGIKICAANNTHAKYVQDTGIVYLINKFDEIDSVLYSTHYERIDIQDVSGGVFWTYDGLVLTPGYYYVTGATDGNLSVKLSSTRSNSGVIKEVAIEAFDSGFKFEITAEDISNGAAYIRLQTTTEQALILSKIVNSNLREDVNKALDDFEEEFGLNPLNGKNVVILGDSISTHGNSGTDPNTVEIEIGAEDVGQTLSAYITKPDVDGGLSIAGHTYTSEEIGTEVTFVPTADDIGKKVGLPLNYNSNSLKVWWMHVKEAFNCNMIPVCWSGSGLTRNRQAASGTNNYTTSYSWHESQIRKCGIRTPGTMQRTDPDAIIITRGGNDWSHSPYAVLTDDYFDNYNVQYPDTDLRQDGKFGFKEAYFMTIGKLREAYPFARIILCTYPPLKRGNYSHFPTNNGIHSIPQYNNAVREIADFCGCEIIEFDKCGITFENMYPTYISDSATNPVHPNAKGHELMGKCAINALKNMDFTK